MSMVWIAGISNPSGSTMAFTNIPQTFTHLQLRVSIRTTHNGSEALYMRFNNASYSFAGHHLIGYGGAAGSTAYTGISYMDLPAVPNSAQASGVFGSYVIDILDYTNTNKNKTIRCLGGYDANTSGLLELCSGLLPTLSPVTEISQLAGTATVGFAAGTRADLYGITSSQVTGA